jgi:apoptosis-inducing factor 3
LKDSGQASSSRRAGVIGASFIGLEVAASLRARGLEVHVVAPQARPMEHVLGQEVGDLVRKVHDAHGVVFHLGTTPASFDRSRITLRSGEQLDADFVVVGVRPETSLTEEAGIAVDRGVIVDVWRPPMPVCEDSRLIWRSVWQPRRSQTLYVSSEVVLPVGP